MSVGMLGCHRSGPQLFHGRDLRPELAGAVGHDPAAEPIEQDQDGEGADGREDEYQQEAQGGVVLMPGFRSSKIRHVHVCLDPLLSSAPRTGRFLPLRETAGVGPDDDLHSPHPIAFSAHDHSPLNLDPPGSPTDLTHAGAIHPSGAGTAGARPLPCHGTGTPLESLRGRLSPHARAATVVARDQRDPPAVTVRAYDRHDFVPQSAIHALGRSSR
jgi:hypothetical protein